MSASAPIFHLLIVDDDPLVCELLTQLLRKDDFAVSSVTSVEAALQTLRQQDYDAVLTDLQMPGIGGLELARHIRSLPQPPLLLGMSARPLLSGEHHLLDEFLHKPFTASDLHAALARATRAHTSLESHDPSTYKDVVPQPAQHAASASDSDGIPETGETGEAQEILSGPPAGTSNPPLDPSLAGVLDLQIFSRLRATLGGPQLSQLYEMTASDVESRLLHMHAYLPTHDLRKLQDEAHAIKGGCAMVGAVELSHLAALAETCSETGTAELKEMSKACLRLRQVVTIVSP